MKIIMTETPNFITPETITEACDELKASLLKGHLEHGRQLVDVLRVYSQMDLITELSLDDVLAANGFASSPFNRAELSALLSRIALLTLVRIALRQSGMMVSPPVETTPTATTEGTP